MYVCMYDTINNNKKQQNKNNKKQQQQQQTDYRHLIIALSDANVLAADSMELGLNKIKSETEYRG